MPFPFSRQTHFSSSSFSPYVNPWARQRSKSPTDELRRSFRSFTCMENMLRAERNERPFCSAQSRDRAFEKLMRLSRGEGVYHWEIEKCESDDEVDMWRGDWEEAQMEMEMERIENLKKERRKEEEGGVAEVEGGAEQVLVGKGEGKELHERKDSKDVVVKSAEGWRTNGHHVLIVQGTHVGDGPEYVEDIAEKK